MSKIVSLQTREMSDLEKALAEEPFSYVLITCTKPSKDGKMHVNLMQKGHPDLISYLVASAQNHLE
ncbi:MAG: hypothetical protein AB7N99_07425 [Simkaniaceae bacterium]|nr:hypothetical protein [Chlamydiia bacterium]